MKQILWIFLVFLFGMPLTGYGSGFSETRAIISGSVTDRKTGEPLIGANVLLLGTSLGAAVDQHGTFVIRNVPYGTYRMRVTMIGYQQAEKEVRVFARRVRVDFRLSPIVLRGRTLVVTGIRAARYLKDTPVHTEVLTSSEIQRRNPVNLLETTRYIPGVQPEVDCSICNASSISIHGMPGRYTQILIDGMPLYGSLGQIYGYLQIPSDMIEQIEVIKGASSVLYGSDAIAGIVNIRTRNPRPIPSLHTSVQLGGFGEGELVASGSYGTDSLGVAFNGTAYRMNPVDQDHNGITEHALVKRTTLFSKLQYRLSPRLTLHMRFSGIQEERQGGAVSPEKSFIATLDAPSLRAFTESILTERVEWAASLNRRTEDSEWFLRGAVTRHFQDSDYEGFVYVGTQLLEFLEMQWNRTLRGRHVLTLGTSYRRETLDENAAIMPYHYQTVSAFAQLDWRPRPYAEIVAGARLDHHNVYGYIFSPGLTLKYNVTDNTALRLTVGRGFRAPTAFYELDHGTGAKYKYNTQYRAKKAETSRSVTLNLDWEHGGWSATVSGFVNRLDNYITAHNDPLLKAFIVENVASPSVVRGAEFSLFYQQVDRLSATLDYLFENYRMPPEALGYPRPEHKLKGTLDCTLPHGWQLNLTGEVTGPMQLRRVFGLAYNEDGSPKRKRSPLYAVLDAQISRRLAKSVQVILGVKNLFDFHQSKVETPLMYDEDGNLGDVIYIWGPLLGRRPYLKLEFEL